MSKKRRTRKEKITASTRQSIPQVLNVFNIPQALQSPQASNKEENSKSYIYVLTDVRKTLLATLIIVIANFIIFTLLKLRIINFLGVNF